MKCLICCDKRRSLILFFASKSGGLWIVHFVILLACDELLYLMPCTLVVKVVHVIARVTVCRLSVIRGRMPMIRV